ncbi:hypothetical protein IP78_10195 [Brevundimonas sp. AAP58]|uniref:hypothetical protein n=1 Tax=Brevundimonas sp. AAP58 TaxID=1523422 RepID=UPI0006B91D2D|nr:hypothetical protein [Brevundimonas sp. AAP58]KPF78878.1 hypothetical protein IP78_10195 [Brevundimonas sp. AAP58]
MLIEFLAVSAIQATAVTPDPSQCPTLARLDRARLGVRPPPDFTPVYVELTEPGRQPRMIRGSETHRTIQAALIGVAIGPEAQQGARACPLRRR